MSVASLGGGNHFIEIDQDNEGCKYLIIHTGSRNLGKQVADIYQDLAIKKINTIRTEDREAVIQKIKSRRSTKRYSASTKRANSKSENSKRFGLLRRSR